MVDETAVDEGGVDADKRNALGHEGAEAELLPMPIPVAIETGRGLLVACLRATGRKVYAINPMAVSRYRDRHSVAGKKSDAGDALVLAHLLRTDMATHQPLPTDSELVRAIAVLARAQQDAVWERTCAHNKLRSLHPARIQTCPSLSHRARLRAVRRPVKF